MQDTTAPKTALTARDHRVLDLERQWWKYADEKEAAIRQGLDMTTERYYRVLNHLIDRPAALAADPQLVRRLRRLRTRRQRERSAARIGLDG